MSERSGAEVLVEVLASEGVRHVFGNPGTTELPLIDELAAHAEIAYVLALQENTAVAMADGYAQATGRPAFVNLHTGTGLGGGVGNLVNALANRTPLVVTAGQADRRHLVMDPILSGNLVGLAQAVSKWQYEVRRLDELGTVIRRAFLHAASPPAGPVFVSIPTDVLTEAGEVEVPARSTVRAAGAADGLEELAGLLAEFAPEGLAIVAGDGIGAAGALEEAAALAEALGSRVFGTVWYSKLNFPTTHPLWAGMLPLHAEGIRATLSPFRRVFVVGAPAFTVYGFRPGPAVPPSAELLQLDAEAGRIGRNHPVRLGVVGDVKASLAGLLPLVRPRVDGARAAAALQTVRGEREAALDQVEARAVGLHAALPMHPLSAVHALLQALPWDGIVLDEAMTSSFHVRDLYRSGAPGGYYFGAEGGLGWVVPAALGVKLGCPERPVLAIVGDGGAMYTNQALWTAAHYRIPVVVAVLNNRQYAILKKHLIEVGGPSARSGTFIGMDIVEPSVDFAGLARSMGVEAAVVEKASEVSDACRTALESGRPWLLELPVAAPDGPER